jgi:hypothetical protein
MSLMKYFGKSKSSGSYSEKTLLYYLLVQASSYVSTVSLVYMYYVTISPFILMSSTHTNI